MGLTIFNIVFFQTWHTITDGHFFSDLKSGLPSALINRETELVDLEFAESLVLKSYPGANLYVIVFEQPTRASHCYYAVIKKGLRS